MVLWTWGKVSGNSPEEVGMHYSRQSQRLEDKFDGKNRMNLRHFIGVSPSSGKSSRHQSGFSTPIQNIVEDDENDPPQSLFLVEKSGSHDPDTTPNETTITVRKDLARIPVCALFYKIAQGQGVPHTFVGQYIRSNSDVLVTHADL
jgi:KUP system potassium uptake protein